MKKQLLSLLFSLSIILLIGCGQSPIAPTLAPQITSFNINSTICSQGQTITLSLYVNNLSNKSLTYQFIPVSGSITQIDANTPTASWKVPSINGNYSIAVAVADDTNTVTASKTIRVVDNPTTYQEIAGQILRTAGTGITDATGNIVQLKGIGFANGVYDDNPVVPANISYYWYAQESDYQKVAGWGANVIRFYMHYKWFEGANLTKIWAFLDQNIAWAKANNLYLILDMHYAHGDIVNPGDKSAFWATEANQTNFKNLWVTIAGKYKDEPTIAGYDLLNEPSPNALADWWVLADETIDAIRATADEHIIFVETNNFAKKIPTKKLNDDNVVYSFHFYEPHDFTHQTSATEYPYSLLNQNYLAGGTYTFAGGSAQNATWTYRDPASTWSTPTDLATHGVAQFGANPNPSAIYWIDDIVITAREIANPSITKNISVYNGTFENGLTGWKAFADGTATINISHVTTENHTSSGNGCVQVTNITAGGNSNFSHNEQSITISAFEIEAGYEYQIGGWTKTSVTPAWNSFRIDYHSIGKITYDKEYVKARINDFVWWGQTNDVPIYIGEFGAQSIAPSNQEEDWVDDVVKEFNANNIHWTYHMYRDTLGTTDEENRADFGIYSEPVDTPIIDDNSIDEGIKNKVFP